MATASSRGKSVRSSQSGKMLVWQAGLLRWGIPTLLGGAIAIIALLAILDQITPTTGVIALGFLLLFLSGFFPLKAAFSGATESSQRVLMLGFSLAWIVITCTQVYFAVFVGSTVANGLVSSEGTAMTLALDKQGTAYDLIVEGTFVAAAGEVGREASYSLSLTKEGQEVQEFSGVFSEHWSRQRLGRRGSTTSHQLHTHVPHPFTSPGEGSYQLTMSRMDPQLSPVLSIALYRDIYPEKTFWVLSFLLLIGAYIGEVLLAGKEVPLVLVTTVALVFVLTFRSLGVPPHSYRDLVGAVMVAVIAGPFAGWFFRVIADTVSKSLGFAVSRPAPAARGKGRR